MKKLKSNKGITLTALVITIIIMLLLVAVTVTYSIRENGILSQSKESAKLAERAQLHEKIMGAMKLTNEGKIDLQATYDAAETMLIMQGYKVGQLQPDGTFEVKGEKGTYKYKLTEREITISDEGNSLPKDEEEDEEIVIASEKDLPTVGYFYNTMYNPEQPEIVGYRGELEDDENDDL